MKKVKRILSIAIVVVVSTVLCGCSERKNSTGVKEKILQSLREDYLWAGKIEDVMNLKKITSDTFVGKVQWKSQYGNVEYFDIAIEFLENGAVEIRSMDHRFRMHRNPFPNKKQ